MLQSVPTWWGDASLLLYLGHAVGVETLDLVVGDGVTKTAFLSYFYGRRDPLMTGGRFCWGLLFVFFKKFRW